MKKRVYRVRTQYIFEGVFEVVAESRYFRLGGI